MTRRDIVVDGLLTAALVVIGVAIALSLEPDAGRRAIAVAIVLAHVSPLIVRRRWPVAVLAVMLVTALLAPVIGVPVVALGPAALVAVYTVATRFPPPRSTALVAIASAGMAVAVVASGMDVGTVATNALAFAVAWWLGDRSRRAIEEADAERAAAADVAARAVADERLRIARELHDVVAHAMSVIAVQAGSGRLVMDESPDVARQALATIETTSRDALQEMRRLLAMLRDGSTDASTLAPSPGVADVGDLVETTARQGIAVHLRTDGEPVELPAGAGLCVFRIVQEALTNVRKHAGATVAEVTLRYGVDAIEVEVVDDGVGATNAKDVGGHGLVGLRERAELYGGAFDASPMPSGFRGLGSHPPRSISVIRVAVADDQPLVRAGFAAVLAHPDDIESVGEAEDGEGAVALAIREHPDVVLMDVRMPRLDGIEATRRIVADDRCSSVKVVILTTFDLDEYVYAALRAGASAFLLKDVAPEQLLDAIRVVADGDALIAPSITKRLIERFTDVRPIDDGALAELTDREREVLVLVARGLSNAEIADRIVVSLPTAKTHVGRILTKLHARDRAQLVALAYETGLIRPGQAT